ncbi:MAG: hypothetical protein ACR2HR_03860 [Euzebya sp.]
MTQDGEFGPGGYLPPRAAKRARKIVLRERMGAHWPIAAVVAGVLILVVTVPFVLSSGGPPGQPFVEAGPLSAIDPDVGDVVDVGGRPVLVIRAGGALRAFVDPPGQARYCPASRRIEAPDGRQWSAQGRLLVGQGQSLRPVQITAYDHMLFIDPTAQTELLQPRIDATSPLPGCPG